MSVPIRVSDSFSNRPEHIQQTCSLLGRSISRRAVYEGVYKGRPAAKSVDELVLATGLERKAILTAGKFLAINGIIGQITGKDGTTYTKVPDQKAIRDDVVRYMNNPAGLRALVTKRSDRSSDARPIFVTSKGKLVANSRRSSKRTGVLRIAILAVSATGAMPLNVGMEVREIEATVQRSENRSKVLVRPFMAATASTLLDALNEFKPQILHFSGHGGGQSLLFDNDSPKEVDGVVMEYAVIRDMLQATDTPPRLLVFNACSTFYGSVQFTDAVEALVTMSDSVGDAAAILFASRFYAAIVSGQSLENAVNQGKAFLMVDNLPEKDLPKITMSEGRTAASMRLI